MRARWPFINLFICIAFAGMMFIIESRGQAGGWWPDSSWRQFLFSLSVGAIILCAVWVVVLIARRIGGRTS